MRKPIRLRKLAVASSNSSSSSSSDSSSSDESLKSAKTHKSKDKKKSGIYDKPSDEVAKNSYGRSQSCNSNTRDLRCALMI